MGIVGGIMCWDCLSVSVCMSMYLIMQRHASCLHNMLKANGQNFAKLVIAAGGDIHIDAWASKYCLILCLHY